MYQDGKLLKSEVQLADDECCIVFDLRRHNGWYRIPIIFQKYLNKLPQKAYNRPIPQPYTS